jgi:transposase, IS6 family
VRPPCDTDPCHPSRIHSEPRLRSTEELVAGRGIKVDHVTGYRWVQRFTPLLADAARFARHAPGDRWFVDETYVKVGGVWRYVYRCH